MTVIIIIWPNGDNVSLERQSLVHSSFSVWFGSFIKLQVMIREVTTRRHFLCEVKLMVVLFGL